MPQGLQIQDPQGNITLDISDRITRILVTDEFPYSDTFTRQYVFPEFLNHTPFVICSSFNVIVSVKDAADVFLSGSPRPPLQCVWYQITWEVVGDTLTLKGSKSGFYVKGTFGTATVQTSRISQPKFKLIIGVY